MRKLFCSFDNIQSINPPIIAAQHDVCGNVTLALPGYSVLGIPDGPAQSKLLCPCGAEAWIGLLRRLQTGLQPIPYDANALSGYEYARQDRIFRAYSAESLPGYP